MRQIVLDTETTGLEPQEGHRIIEVGCLEISNRRITRNTFHHYVNPEREIDEGAVEVHGITYADLKEKPSFAEIAESFIEFVRGAELIIHNAPFDVGFIDAELARLGDAWGELKDYCTIFDTLTLARDLHPGQRNNLDALCRRYEVDNAHRDLHGALLDAELLAEVYLSMTGGQAALELVSEGGQAVETLSAENRGTARTDLKVVAINEDDANAHRAMLDRIERESGGTCLWRTEPEDITPQQSAD